VTRSSSQSHSGRHTPLVSIVVATYERSNVLRLAIESVLRSTFCDWELLVIGDCCTDDSDQIPYRLSNARGRSA